MEEKNGKVSSCVVKKDKVAVWSFAVGIASVFLGSIGVHTAHAGLYYLEPANMSSGTRTSEQFSSGVIFESSTSQLPVFQQMYLGRDIVLLPDIFTSAQPYSACTEVIETMNTAIGNEVKSKVNEKNWDVNLPLERIQFYIDATTNDLSSCIKDQVTIENQKIQKEAIEKKREEEMALALEKKREEARLLKQQKEDEEVILKEVANSIEEAKALIESGVLKSPGQASSTVIEVRSDSIAVIPNATNDIQDIEVKTILSSTDTSVIATEPEVETIDTKITGEVVNSDIQVSQENIVIRIWKKIVSWFR